MTQTRRATYHDVIDAPPRMVAEILNGRLHLQPYLGLRHNLAYSRLGAVVCRGFDYDERRRDWWVLNRVELHLGEDVLVPEVSGWRRARLPVLPDVQGMTLAPDWVCEVMTPATRAYDRVEKTLAYAAHGIAHLWLVDVEARTLEAFTLDQGRWVLIAALADDAPVCVAPFDAVPWSLSTLWPPEMDAPLPQPPASDTIG